MGLAKYRSDKSKPQADGAILWFANWIGGPSLSKIENCQWESLDGQPRVTVHIQSEPDTYFSQPAKCYYQGKIVKGYVTGNETGLVFNHCYY